MTNLTKLYIYSSSDPVRELSTYDNGNEGEFFKIFINLRKLKFTYANFTTKFVDAIMPLKHLEKIDILKIRDIFFVDGSSANFQLTKFLNNSIKLKILNFLTQK
jgi:hypothetical protein